MPVARLDRVTTRVHEVRLAKTNAAVQVKRIVSSTRRFSDGGSRSVIRASKSSAVASGTRSGSDTRNDGSIGATERKTLIFS